MITYDSSQSCFHLTNGRISMVILVRTDDMGAQELVMPYVGTAIPDCCGVENLLPQNGTASFDSKRQLLPYCVPTEGRGDHRPCLVAAEDKQGFTTTELYYTGDYAIVPGKPALSGLPATYVENEEEAETLILMLQDPVSLLMVKASYTIFADHDAIAASLLLSNGGEDELTLVNAGSLALSLPGRWDMLHLQGAWARERRPERVAPAAMTRQIESVRGASGHEHNPFAALMASGATAFEGQVFGVSLVYSGDFRMAVDENAYDATRLVAGLNPRTFRWKLAPGESFQTPEAVLAISDKGLNGMSQIYHKLYRTRLVRGEWRDKERPILINNWEATYFNFNHEKIMDIARTAADLGVELFVLDDGWFGVRDDDNCSLGDWTPDLRKLPRGLKALAEDINGLGLRFGLWFEPEMISPNSDLYRAHPDWCLHVPGRRRTQARSQLILDMSRAEVQEYVIQAVSGVLASAPIGYVKWDMNRNFAEAGSAVTPGGELHHRYMLGVYRVMDAITSAFPQVLFESCSGGGGRFDAGILYYMPQTWTSDDTDAMERLKLQWGTSIVYPASAMGAHVSAVPNHQVHRTTPINTRGQVAMGGNFGYELDLSAQTAEDKEMIRAQVAFVKQIRRTTQQGVFTRLCSPFEGELTAWTFRDDDTLLVFACRRMSSPSDQTPVLRLHDIPEGTCWKDEQGCAYTASALMGAGIRVPLPAGDFQSVIVTLKRN